MAKKRSQFWLITYYLPGIKAKQWSVSPAYKFPWQVRQWLKDQKPSAEIVSVQPYRSMSVPK